MTMLIKVLLMSRGEVVECGGGVFSTPLLHWMCKAMGRKLITYENEPDYYEFEKTFQSPLHRVRFVRDWDEINTSAHCGVVLIDHHPPKRRSIEAIRFKDTADYIVIHDTERDNKEYDNSRIWSYFKYRYDWKACKPWTSVVSNFYDLSNLTDLL
jgi:hypothetical protein